MEAQDKAVHEGTDVSRGLEATIRNTDLIIHPLSSYPAVAKNAVSIKIFVHRMLGGPQLSVRDVRGAKKTQARPEPKAGLAWPDPAPGVRRELLCANYGRDARY